MTKRLELELRIRDILSEVSFDESGMYFNTVYVAPMNLDPRAGNDLAKAWREVRYALCELLAKELLAKAG